MPVMKELSKRGVPFRLISSGQNRMLGSELLQEVGIDHPDIVLSDREIARSPLALLVWFFETLFTGIFKLRRELKGLRGKGVLVVHGDTVTTVMGAFLGKLFGLKVAHIEAGLRSFNFLQPFPEEIDRYLTSYFADIHFCPYAKAVNNLRRRRGLKVDTRFNSNIDSLAFALSRSETPPILRQLSGSKYFIFIMHRQENLLNRAFVKDVVSAVIGQSRNIKCVFVMHELTQAVLTDLGLLGDIASEPNVISIGRMPYLQFVQLLDSSQFIVTDGGGNQQEAYYLGKPCLILRDVTEGTEGIGSNVVLSQDIDSIHSFMAHYGRWRRSPVVPDIRPSDIIADTLIQA